MRTLIVVAILGAGLGVALQGQGQTPLFFREPWRQSRPMDASTNFRPEGGVTTAAVTNPALELKIYDPLAKNVASYKATPPTGSIPVDWDGPSCIQLAGPSQSTGIDPVGGVAL